MPRAREHDQEAVRRAQREAQRKLSIEERLLQNDALTKLWAEARRARGDRG